MSFEQILRVSRIFGELGVRKYRITGGEPLLRPGLPGLIQELSAQPYVEDLALTTNGALLSDYAGDLFAAGLKRLTVSLDALDARVFRSMSGHRGTSRQVLDGIKAAELAGFSNLKINVVVQRGVNDHQVIDLIEHFRGSGHIVRFIEYMDVGTCNHWQSDYVVPSKELLRRVSQVYPLRAVDENYFGEVAKRYTLLDGSAEIGFISSISQPFCDSCTRVRLTADGRVVTCLFASDGHSIREFLSDSIPDGELKARIAGIWSRRRDRYSQERRSKSTSQEDDKMEMFQIGG